MVNLIISGVQKGGSSALFAYLRRHPQIIASQVKELHHFDDEETVDWSNPDHTRYRARWPAGPAGTVRMEATPIYIFWPPSQARMRAFDPDLRQIIVFRDPIERAFSHWCMEYARGWETLCFEEALEQEATRLAEAPPLSRAWRVCTYQSRGYYAAQLRRLLAIFPPDSLLCLSSTELRQAPAVALRRATDFLALDPFPDVAPLVANPRKDVAYPSVLTPAVTDHLRGKFHADLTDFTALSGLDTRDWRTFRG